MNEDGSERNSARGGVANTIPRNNPRACSMSRNSRNASTNESPSKLRDTSFIQILSGGAIFFPNANSSGSGATALSEPVFSSDQRYSRRVLCPWYTRHTGSPWGVLVAQMRESRCEMARGCLGTSRSLSPCCLTMRKYANLDRKSREGDHSTQIWRNVIFHKRKQHFFAQI